MPDAMQAYVAMRVRVTWRAESLRVAQAYNIPPWVLGVPGYSPAESRMRTAYRRRQLARRRRNRR